MADAPREVTLFTLDVNAPTEGDFSIHYQTPEEFEEANAPKELAPEGANSGDSDQIETPPTEDELKALEAAEEAARKSAPKPPGAPPVPARTATN